MTLVQLKARVPPNLLAEKLQANFRSFQEIGKRFYGNTETKNPAVSETKELCLEARRCGASGSPER